MKSDPREIVRDELAWWQKRRAKGWRVHIDVFNALESVLEEMDLADEREAIRMSERITAEDLAVTINCTEPVPHEPSTAQCPTCGRPQQTEPK